MENDAEKIFSDLREEVSVYARLKLRLLKLMAIEKTAGILSVFSHGLILMLFVFFTLLFLFISLGFYLGDLLGNVALGFLIVGGIYFLLTCVLILARGKIQLRLMNIFVCALCTNNNEDDHEDPSTDTSGPIDARKAGGPATMPGNRNENQA